MKSIRFIGVAVMLSLASNLVFSAPSSKAGEQTKSVVFSGSSTILPIMEMASSLYQGYGYKIKVQGGGSSAGIKSVKMGMADVGMVSRSITGGESKVFEKYTFAKDWVVLIANGENKLESLSKDKVSKIYSGQVSSWPDGQSMTIIGKENGRATKRVFDEYFSLRKKLRRDVVIIGANGQAIVSVENDKNALAYVSYSAAYKSIESGANIKILKLDGVFPNIESVQEGKYKLTRELNLVYLPKNKNKVQPVLDVLKDEKMKKLVEGYHMFYSL